MTEQASVAPSRTMMAAQRDRYGPPEVVALREVPVPTPKEGQVLVRLHAASVNRADLDGLKPRPGFVRLFMGLRAPRNPGIGADAAGVVEEVGPGVTRLKPGDAVMGDMFIGGQGSFAEYVCAAERAFQPIPAGMTMVQASTLPHSAVLALQGLRLRSGRTIKAGDRVLIDGASGNVGPFAVQIAKAMGAEVTGVASTDKLDLVRSIGADHVIDYTSVDYTKAGERYDWIVDTDTHHGLRGVRRALRRDGVYVTLGGESGAIVSGGIAGPLLSRFSDRSTGLLLWWKPMHPPDVDRLKELIAAGELKPVIERTYPLTEVVAALRHVEDGRARGKVVVTMDEGPSGRNPDGHSDAGDGRPGGHLADRRGIGLGRAGADPDHLRPDEYVYRGLRAGASGFVLRDIPPAKLVAAVRTSHATLDELVERFGLLRAANLTRFEAMVGEADLDRRGMHPSLGEVTVRQLVATRAVHDLDHVTQILAGMAGAHDADVGPWKAYLGILLRRDDPSAIPC